jgi:hypothetical protein
MSVTAHRVRREGRQLQIALADVRRRLHNSGQCIGQLARLVERKRRAARTEDQHRDDDQKMPPPTRQSVGLIHARAVFET